MQLEDIPLEVAFEIVQRAILAGKTDLVASWLAKEVIPQYLPFGIAGRYFRLWEENGFHITENNFYSPIPDTRRLREELWGRESQLVGIEMNEDSQLRLLRDVFPQFREEFAHFPLAPTDNPYEFHFGNNKFGGTDALVLYCMIRCFRPNTIVEVGSGYSTRIGTLAASRNGDTSLICIDPYPDEVLRSLPGVTRLLSKPVQEIELDLFEALGPNDILFIDSTHVARIGGDVPFLILEVLPRLQPGVIVHVHDIFLPGEYPRGWILDLHLFWNEQYLLHSFLLFNSAFEVLFSNSFMGLRHFPDMKETFPNSPWWGGGSFWMRREPEAVRTTRHSAYKEGEPLRLPFD
jgi:predicted O-methyltransferase YrrM